MPLLPSCSMYFDKSRQELASSLGGLACRGSPGNHQIKSISYSLTEQQMTHCFLSSSFGKNAAEFSIQTLLFFSILHKFLHYIMFLSNCIIIWRLNKWQLKNIHIYRSLAWRQEKKMLETKKIAEIRLIRNSGRPKPKLSLNFTCS